MAQVPFPDGERTRNGGTILVAVDFKEPSTKALARALSLAKRLNASIVLLHVVEQPYGQGLLNPARKHSIAAETNREALQRLEAMVAPETRARTPVTCLVRRGTPEFEIVRAVQTTGASLIVMGHRPRNPLHHLIFGCRVQDVTNCAPCPVLVVNHAGSS